MESFAFLVAFSSRSLPNSEPCRTFSDSDATLCEKGSRRVSMAMLRSPLVANWKSPPFADVQLVLSRVPPFALACRMR